MSDDPTRTKITMKDDRPPVRPEDMRRAVLVVMHPPGPELGRRFPLDATVGGYDIGRLADLPICLEVDGVSRRHARLEFQEGVGWKVKDLGSTNGVVIGEQRVTEHVLADGERFILGDAILKFLPGTDVESRYHEALYDLSVKDALTGVFNKRYFLEILDREISRSLRHSSPLGLLLFDLDHFKKVNDTYGHLAGDAVLREVGRRLPPRLRKEDVFARYGGEEFACIMPNTTQAAAVKVAEALRERMASAPVRFEDKEIVATISVGVTSVPVGEQGVAQALIAAADARLYEAKRAGRNCVIG